MAVNPYYVGSTLTDIGNNMSRDYATDAQLRAAELQARNQFAAILQQAVQAQANRAQQNDQFGQEMAYRNAALGQNNSQFGSNLDYMREALKAQLMNQEAARRQQGEQFNAEQAYRNAALAQTGDLKSRELGQGQAQFDANLAYLKDALTKKLAGDLESTRLQFPPERWKAEDSRVLAERLQQQGLLQRADMDYNSKVEYENELAKSLASQYNTLLAPIKAEAEKKAKDGFLWSTRSQTDPAYIEAYNKVLDPEVSRLVQTLQGQPITYNAATREFSPVLGRPRQTMQAAPQQPQAGGPTGLLQLLYNRLTSGQQAPAPAANPPLGPAGTNPIITIRDSTGRTLNIKASDFPIARQRDPGVSIVQPGQNRAAVSTPATEAAQLIQSSGVNPQLLARLVTNSGMTSTYPNDVRDRLFSGLADAAGIQGQQIGSSIFSTSPGNVLLNGVRGGNQDMISNVESLPQSILDSNALHAITNGLTASDFEKLKQIIQSATQGR